MKEFTALIDDGERKFAEKLYADSNEEALGIMEEKYGVGTVVSVGYIETEKPGGFL